MADAEVLWQRAAGVATWSRVAEDLQLGVPEITAQLQLVDQVLTRFRQSGRICFEGDEYRQAVDGVLVMDALAAATDTLTALDAAVWSERQMQRMARADVLRLDGERAVLLGLLTDCAAVLRTIDPDDSYEAGKLADLLTAIDRAQAPDRHQGALL